MGGKPREEEKVPAREVEGHHPSHSFAGVPGTGNECISVDCVW